jgi:hypothetical protein
MQEISIFSNSSHLEWRAGLSDTILKWDYPRTIPAKFTLIWSALSEKKIWMWSFIKICLTCIIGKNRLKEKFHRKIQNICSTTPRYVAAVKYLSSFWLKLKQQWTIEEISIFSNSSQLEWRAGLSDTILKWDYPCTTSAKFGLIWFSGIRGEDLNVIFYQNIPNLHNR